MHKHTIVGWLLVMLGSGFVGCGASVPEPVAGAPTSAGPEAAETQIAARPEGSASKAAGPEAVPANTAANIDSKAPAIIPSGLILPDPSADALDPKGPKLRRE